MEPSKYSDSAYFIAVMAASVSGLFTAGTPFILAAILWRGGFGTVPVYDGHSHEVLFYANNVAVAVAFSGAWLTVSALVFRHARKVLAQLNKQRNAA